VSDRLIPISAKPVTAAEGWARDGWLAIVDYYAIDGIYPSELEALRAADRERARLAGEAPPLRALYVAADDKRPGSSWIHDVIDHPERDW
jgi:hypothetical protein